jgi:uncharacterized protein YndB with AHSA1/START domain
MTGTDLTLHLERILDAPPSLVFTMFVESDRLARWWGPKGFTAPCVEFDPRPGGRYRIRMQPPDGDPFSLSGEIRAIDPPSHLSYTFRWEEPDPDDRDTVVSVSMFECGTCTRLTVDQGPFATEARRSLHDQGWSETLDRLRRVLADDDQAGDGRAGPEHRGNAQVNGV